MENMTQEQIDFQERVNAGTSPTKNEDFNKDGYFVIKNLCNPEDLYCEPPENKGQYTYYGKLDRFDYIPVEMQVEGSTSRYYYPPYKYIHSQIRSKLENAIGNELYNTYYYDRFYNPGQELKNHADRPACEISVTVHISTNITTSWPIWIKTPDTYNDATKSEIIKKGENRSVILSPGDGMLYKGCERPHFREPMPTEYHRTWYGKKIEKEGLYYHQVFFHYVLADGLRANFAFDRR
tara:strand:+ start:773 stop:1483 length:711 start_codon:yes stop_codon:yes gene_type:complete